MASSVGSITKQSITEPKAHVSTPICYRLHREGACLRPKPDMKPEDLFRWLALLTGMPLGKIKLLGGEAFLHPQLIFILRKIRDVFPTTDLSVVTNGCVPPEIVKAASANGLDRINLSLHGFTLEEATARSGCTFRQYHQRM
ncbi:MAG: radical SAM protein, partial [Verrucomicrobiota bacterium]